MLIRDGRYGENSHTGGTQQNRLNYADILNEETCERQARRLAAECDQAEDAVDTALQSIGDEREPVTELYDVRNAAERGTAYGNSAQRNRLGSDRIQRDDWSGP